MINLNITSLTGYTFEIETEKFDETNIYRGYKSSDDDYLSIDICLHMINKMKDDFCKRIGVDNWNEHTDRRHHFKVLKDNHYYSSNEYYETQKYKPEYIILIYENEILNTDTAEHLTDGDSLTFIIDIERYEEMNFQKDLEDYY